MKAFKDFAPNDFKKYKHLIGNPKMLSTRSHNKAERASAPDEGVEHWQWLDGSPTLHLDPSETQAVHPSVGPQHLELTVDVDHAALPLTGSQVAERRVDVKSVQSDHCMKDKTADEGKEKEGTEPSLAQAASTTTQSQYLQDTRKLQEKYLSKQLQCELVADVSPWRCECLPRGARVTVRARLCNSGPNPWPKDTCLR